MKIVTVRKNHQCDNPDCKKGHFINKGEKAITILDKLNNYFETYYYHPGCEVYAKGVLY